MGKESACNAGDTGNVDLIPGWEWFHGGGNGNPFQYSCLENPMDRGDCRLQSMGLQGGRQDWVTKHYKKEKVSVRNLFLIDLFLIGGWLLYNIVLVSALHQHESAIAYICLQGYIFMKPFVQIVLINMETVKYDPSYKKSLLHIHLSTSNNLFLYSCYFILSLGLCSNLLETLYASHSLFYLDFHFYHLIDNTESYLSEVNLCFSFAGLVSHSVVSDSLRACGL